ncbi:hypothetical protein Cgig2_033185 [Carnegiea gigantea]|uniref:Cytochrome P450 n=1 Tax=Carnegiea gigantea TaxID=171969 RepID=A0A9Q1JUU5_9CARY|nr:hypothetical protein Cgig2_033185 [Carnegiea gigantea]
MESWFVLIVAGCLASAMLKAFLFQKPNPKLPPGPQGFPIISSIKWLRKSLVELEAALISLRTRLGPIIRIPMGGSQSVVFILDYDLANEALAEKGAIFADRPNISPITRQLNITLAGYGPTWRTLRRNLTSLVLPACRLKEYSHSRGWALDVLINRLSNGGGSSVKVVDYFQFAIFCLLVHMCFGGQLEESKIKEVMAIQRQLLVSSTRFQILNFLPRLTRILLRKRWEEFLNLRKRQQEVISPLIRARKDIVKDNVNEFTSSSVSYVDTLLNLEIQDDHSGSKRKLTEDELISACSEFLSGGTDTTLTALQWIMANLVKYPEIQARLFDEIRGVVGAEAEHVGEEDLPEMPYLKAVVLEGLRRHPPTHFLVPHSVTQDVELGGYLLPKNAVVNFNISEMGWDPKFWDDPMEFKPERFMPADQGSDGQVEFDITGGREKKMMPFGAGRRMCPAFGLAILHLEYFVANLVRKFEWATATGHDVDLTENQEFTIVMKHPLHARISPRKLSNRQPFCQCVLCILKCCHISEAIPIWGTACQCWPRMAHASPPVCDMRGRKRGMEPASVLSYSRFFGVFFAIKTHCFTGII